MRIRPSLLALPVVCLAASSAHGQIMQPGTQPTGSPGGIERSIQTSGSCATCHGDYDDADDYEPFDSWRGSLMGSAGRDPVFRAALSIAEADNPAAADFCVRCHSPVAWLAGRAQVPAWSMESGPRFAPDEPGYLSSDLDGVACMVCHRATDEVPSDPEAPHLRNARIHYLDGAESEVHQGPYAYEGDPPRHPARQSDYLAEGAFCGQCHDIDNPVVMGHRADGTATGRDMVLERTFSEWAASDHAAPGGQTCQDCHMRRIEGDGFAASDLMVRPGVRRHDLTGSTSWVLRAMASIYDLHDVTTAAWLRSAELADEMLRSAAFVDVHEAVASPGEVSVHVRVTNIAGHKLPTGYPEGRRMWLQIEVLDEAGSVLAGSGLYDEGEMRLVEDEQARTYEVKLGQGPTPSFHLMLDDTLLSDTRIPPAGFRPPPDRDMEPVGRDYGDGAGGYRNYDDATFRFPVCGTGRLRVRVRLRFQSSTREYMELLRDNAPDDPDPVIDNWGAIAYAAWESHGGGTPTDMVDTTTAVEGECTLPDAGPSSGPIGPVCGCSMSAAPVPRGLVLVLAMLGCAVLWRSRGKACR